MKAQRCPACEGSGHGFADRLVAPKGSVFKDGVFCVPAGGSAFCRVVRVSTDEQCVVCDGAGRVTVGGDDPGPQCSWNVVICV